MSSLIYRDRIVEHLMHLSDEKAREVLDFVEFLRDREELVPMSQRAEGAGRGSIARYAFCGMWKDREDMRDSATWVQRQRAQWNERLDR